jgi:hypothetical protein
MCGEVREIPSDLPMLFVIESSDSSKLNYDSVNNEEVGTCLDLENTSLKNISPVGHCGWQGKEFDLQNCDGTFVAKGHVMGPNSLRSTKILSCCHPFCTPLHSLI